MAGEIYQYVTGKVFTNICNGQPAFYDYRTKYGYLFAKNGGYIMCKEEVLEQIRLFLELEGLR